MGTIWRSSRRTSAARPEGRPRLSAGPAALVLLLGLGVGCGGDGGGGMAGVVGSFNPSGNVPAQDRVRLRAGAAAADMVTVEAVLLGPATSSDIYSFAFDIVLSDVTVAQYVPNSVAAGGALVAAGGQGIIALASQSGDRVTVGVSKSMGGAGNGVGAGDQVVVRLTFQVLRAGSTTLTFAGSPANPQNPTNAPAALDSSGAVIASISFDCSLAVPCATAATLTGS